MKITDKHEVTFKSLKVGELFWTHGEQVFCKIEAEGVYNCFNMTHKCLDILGNLYMVRRVKVKEEISLELV